MPMPNDPDDYELRDEYDLADMTVLPKGRFSPERRTGNNVVLLEPEIARAFPNDAAVNEALRLVLRMAELPRKQEPGTVSGSSA